MLEKFWRKAIASVITPLPVVLVLFTFFSVPAHADLILDRGLPSENLNNSSGTSRSNVAWGYYQNQYFTGDSFSLSSLAPGSSWVIDSVRVWGIAGNAQGRSLGDLFSSISLYGGYASTGVSEISSGDFLSGLNVVNNQDISLLSAQYSDGSVYQGYSGSYIPVWQVDFNNLNWVVNGGSTLNFGISALSIKTDEKVYWANHASNAALSGTNQEGADGLLNWYNLADLSAVGGGSFSTEGKGWDKASDTNIQVFGHVATPEPASLLLMGVGAAGAAFMRRRKASKVA